MALPIPVDTHFLSGRAPPEEGASGTFDCEAERRLVNAGLDARRRRAYELIFEQGLSVRVTAAALGCDPGPGPAQPEDPLRNGLTSLTICCPTPSATRHTPPHQPIPVPMWTAARESH